MAQTPGCICSEAYILSWANGVGMGQTPKAAPHSTKCVLANERSLDYELYDRIAWFVQDKPCSGSGMAHKAHGKCGGYTYDRT